MRYTQSEDNHILAHYYRKPVHVIAGELGRSVSSVTNRHVRLQSNKARMELALVRGRWSEMEDEYLRQHFGRYRDEALSKALGRSITALRSRAHILGLVRVQVSSSQF